MLFMHVTHNFAYHALTHMRKMQVFIYNLGIHKK